MARKKQYVREEVIKKAMLLFWRNGYKNTSMQMLEKEMNINKFSIYASFGSKHGVFLECLKSYNKSSGYIFENLKRATNGIDDIKKLFCDSANISFSGASEKGCLISNTHNEFSNSNDKLVNNQTKKFMDALKDLFIEKLKLDTTKDEETIVKEANFLLLAKHGLSAALRVNNKKEISDYIEMTFKNI
jgi:AcrR family transcriptional regulator